MTNEKEFEKQTNLLSVTPVIVGAGIGFLVISFFVFGVDNPNPAWGKYWMIRPLIVTPLAGAIGGVFYNFMNYQISKGFNRTFGITLSIIVFLVGLWLGIVLGLAGTMWN